MVRKKEVSEENLKEKTKKISIKEGIAASLMDGAGPRYITPYALALGANNAQIGFLSSIPSLLGNLSELFLPKLIEKHSRKNIILLGVFLQAIMWIPIILIGYLFFYRNIGSVISANLLIVFYTLLVIAGAFWSPAWNSLIRDVVSKKIGEYFGKRGKIITIVIIITMLVSGVILNYFKKINYLFIGFGILFGIAFVARLISGFLMKKHYEPKLELKKGYYFSLWDFVKSAPKSNFGKFAIFIGLMTLVASISSPFGAVYILKDLHLDYIIWTLIIVANAVGSIIFMPFWGKFADKYGTRRVMYWTGALIFLIPIFWFTTMFTAKIGINFAIGQLLLAELFSGFVWGGFNLSAINFIYDAVTREKLTLCITYYNILNGIGVFIGASLGGIVASMNLNFLGVTPILFVFLLSALGRFIVYIFIIPQIKEVREVKEYKNGEFRKEIRKILTPSPFKMIKTYINNTISTKYI